MNTAQNMLPVQPAAKPAGAGKSTAARPNSKQQSFSDTLSGSVAKADKALAAAREQASTNEAKQAGSPMPPGGIPSPVKKTGNTANSQIPAQPVREELAAAPADSEPADLTQLGQQAMAVANTGLFSQMLPAVTGAYLLPAAGAEAALTTEVAAIAASVDSASPETAAVPSVPVLPAQPARQPMAAAVPVEADGVPHLDARPAGVQTGQAQLPVNPVMAEPATAIAADLTQSAVAQTVLAVPGKEAMRATEQQAAAVLTADTEQQPALPVTAAASPAGTSRQDAGEGQQESLADSALFEQALSPQPANANLKEGTPSLFLPGLETALLSKTTDALAGQAAEGKLPTGPAADMYQVVDQIVEQSRVITKLQNTAMVIKLKPEHLGELTLKVVVENGAVNASFHSNNPEVRSLIEASLPQLKQELASSGLKVENVGVYAGLSQFLPNHDQERNSRQQFAKLTNKKNSGEFVEAIVAEMEAGKMNGTGGQAGVDYRI